jgi:hypothetical protein
MDAFDEAWSILKARPFHRQRVLPMGSDKHMRLQQWANRHPSTKAMEGAMRIPFRDQLMRNAVQDPEMYGLQLLDNIPHPDDMMEEAEPEQPPPDPRRRTVLPPAEGGKPEMPAGQKTLFEF